MATTSSAAAGAAPTVYINGKTTWLNNSDWKNGGQKVSKLASFIQKCIPCLYKKMKASLPEEALVIDCGSKAPSARLLSRSKFGNKTELDFGTITDKKTQESGPTIETAEKEFLTEIIRASLKAFPNRKIIVLATAWARPGFPDAIKVNQTARVAFLDTLEGKYNTPNAKRVSYTLVSQKDEGDTNQISVENLVRMFKQVFGKIIGRPVGVDGGNGSTQGAEFELNFGAAQTKTMLESDGVDGTLKYVYEECEKTFKDLLPNEAISAPIFGGSHAFALIKNKTVCTKLGLTKDSPEWQQGIEAKTVSQALYDTIAEQRVVFEKGCPAKPTTEKLLKEEDVGRLSAADKAQYDLDEPVLKAIKKYNDAHDDLKGLVITANVLSQYITKRGATTVRIGAFQNGNEERKPTHYDGAYLRSFVIPFFQNPANHTKSQRFFRFLAKKLDL